MPRSPPCTSPQVDDLVLDVPEAVDMLALFVARAVVDDVLPPALVHRVAAPSSEHLPEVQKKVSRGAGAGWGWRGVAVVFAW